MTASGDSGQSSERVVAELRRLLPAPAERDLPAGRQQTLKEHLMSELLAVGVRPVPTGAAP